MTINTTPRHRWLMPTGEDMKAKPIVVLLLPLAVSGCMMAGMATMEGTGAMSGGGARRSGDAEVPHQPSVIKEVTSGAVRVTVEFPPFALGNALRCAATIQDRDGQAVSGDAAIFLDVSPATSGGPVVSPVETYAGHPPKIVHASADGLERTRLTPAERGGGRYVFRPIIPVEGAYRLAVVVEGVGNAVLEPPIVIEYIAQVTSTAPAAPLQGRSTWGGGLTPFVLLGASLMAVMMLVVVR